MQNVIGLMSGTSMDGVDVAWLRTDGRARIAPGPAMTVPYRDDERAAVRAVLGINPSAFKDGGAFAAAVTAVTQAHIRTIETFLAAHPGLHTKADLIGFHGQTTFHDPENGVTVQIGDAERLAAHFGLPVVSDFRTADVAAGGQGAPFAPLYHAALASVLPRPLAVLNLGGVGNVTWMSGADDILAFDTGPASALIDDWVLRQTGQAFDRDGALAATGQPDQARITDWLSAPYFAAPPPKSLDRQSFEADVAGMSAADGAATLTRFTVLSVARALGHLPEAPHRWLVTGGGRHNGHMMRSLAEELQAPVDPVEAVGWDGDALEAQAFAWLAVRSLEGLPLSVPGTTGVSAPCPGGRLSQPPAAISARRRST